jgi:hypothetical protein
MQPCDSDAETGYRNLRIALFLPDTNLKLLGRILITLIALLAIVFVCLNWIAPVGLSFYAAKKAPPVTRVVPQPLTDNSISQTPGTKLSYFGYDFEVPWTDLDDNLTKLSPDGKSEKCRADLHFRSGLHMLVTAVPSREWSRGVAKEMKLSPEAIEAAFGPGTSRSDYAFVKALYEFTPERMHHWTASTTVWSRDQMLLMIKSIALLKSAESGIFAVQNQNYLGFQEGNPSVRQDGIAVHLFSDNGSVEMLFFQKAYKSPTGVTQPEINRIIQSLCRTSPNASQAAVPKVKKSLLRRAATAEISPAHTCGEKIQTRTESPSGDGTADGYARRAVKQNKRAATWPPQNC